MKKIFFFFSLLLISIIGLAQNDNNSNSNSSDSPRVIVFDTPPAVTKMVTEDEQNIKLNVLAPLTGDIPLHFEKKLGEKFSVEGSAGITIQNFMRTAVFDFNELYSDVDINRSYEPGYSVSAAFKYYPNGAIYEYYFGPEIRHRRYNSSAFEVGVPGEYQEYMNLTDFKLVFGYLDYLDDHIIIDLFAGVGIRSRSQEMLTYVSYDPTTGQSVNEVRLETENKLAPLISLGVKFGFSF